MSKHIVIICNEYPPAPGGGIGTFYKTLGEALVNHGYRVTVGGIYSSVSNIQIEAIEGVEVWRLPSTRRGRGMYTISMFLDRYKLSSWVKSVVIPGEPTIIESADYQGWLWSIPQIAPRIIRVHGADVLFHPLSGLKVSRLKRYFEMKSLHKADYIISSSKFVTSLVESLLNDKRVSSTIYNMVDTIKFSPSVSIKRDPYLVISVATLTKKKGVFQLLDAWRIVHAEVPEAKLVYYGRDIYEGERSTLKQLEEYAKDHNLSESVSFAGSWPYDDLVNVFRKAGVIVFPSYVEAHPRAWLEAMSTGGSVIGSNRGPGPEVIRHLKTGLIIDPDDIQKLGVAILKLIRQPELAYDLGVQARQSMVENYSIGSILELNLNFYEECITQFYAPHKHE